MGAGATPDPRPRPDGQVAEALRPQYPLQENWSLTLNPGLHLEVSQPRLGCLDQCPPSLFTAWEKLRSKPHNWLT